MKKKVYLIIFLICLCVVFIFVALFINNKEKELQNINQTITNTIYDSASSSIVMDINTKRVLYKNNIDQRMLPASTTKILTCITALKLYNLDDFVIITSEMLMVDGSSIYLKVGDVISVEDLLYGLMLCSGNDAAMSLAIHYSGKIEDFVFEMNEMAKEIGMTSSTFENPHGLDENSKNYTTTYDMALLMSYAMKNETFRKITKTTSYNPTIISNRKFYFRNKHRLIRENENVTGGKTGYTKKARRTLVTSFEKEGFEIVVVTFDCSDDWNVHTSLANYVFEKYHLQKITSKFELLLKTNNNFYIDSNLLYYPKIKQEEVTFKLLETNDYLKLEYYVNDLPSGYVIFRRINNE